MTEEKLPGEENLPEGFGEDKAPDTDTGSEDLAGLADEPAVQPAIPVAPPVEPAAGDEESGPPPAPAGPRVFPQQYTMLFANTFVLVGCLTVWERATVTGLDVYGFQMIGGAIVMGFAAYAVLAGIVGLVRGGVNFFSTLGTGFFALYFAIKTMVRISGHEQFQYYGDLNDKLGTQGAVNAFLAQFGPGVWMTLIGGVIIIIMFLKAMFGGKKKEPAPQPARRRARR